MTNLRVRRATVAALTAVLLLTGCGRTVAGQVAMTTEPLSPDITCAEFVALSDGDRLKVVSQALGEQQGAGAQGQAFLLSALAGVLCKGAPETPLKDILSRMKVR